jgi:RimJ/RimL family protein N-acetyltransferase
MNPRMALVAKRVGFVFEGAERDMVYWQGEWLGTLHFSILRTEWESGRPL